MTYLGVVGELGDSEERLRKLGDFRPLRRDWRKAAVSEVQRRAAGLERCLR